MRLLVTMVAGLLSVLLGPSLAREGRTRSIGSSMTLLTRCRSSRSPSTPRRPHGSWLARGESLLWVRRLCRRINLRRLQPFGVVPVVGMPGCCTSVLPGLGVGVVGTWWPTMAPFSSSVQKLWLCPWAVGRGVSGIIEWRAWGISFVVLSWVSLRMDGGWVARSCLDGGGLGVCEGRDHMGSRLGEGTGLGAHGWWCFYICFTWNLLGMFVSRWGGRWVA